MDPLGLLDMLKEIEKDLGRQKSIANGPRPIDLDILLYDTQVISDERLSVPHPRIMEREFVLQPLCEYNSSYNLKAISALMNIVSYQIVLFQLLSGNRPSNPAFRHL